MFLCFRSNILLLLVMSCFAFSIFHLIKFFLYNKFQLLLIFQKLWKTHNSWYLFQFLKTHNTSYADFKFLFHDPTCFVEWIWRYIFKVSNLLKKLLLAFCVKVYYHAMIFENNSIPLQVCKSMFWFHFIWFIFFYYLSLFQRNKNANISWFCYQKKKKYVPIYIDDISIP